MSKYTAEQVEAEADCLPDAYEDQAAKLRDYAALLRERESAKAAVTDALKVVLLEHRLSEWTDEDGNPLPLIDHLSSGNTIKSGADEIDRIIDAVEEAVAPMLASARVPEGWMLVPVMPTPKMLGAMRSTSINRHSDMYQAALAAAPKPDVEERHHWLCCGALKSDHSDKPRVMPDCFDPERHVWAISPKPETEE